MDAVKSAPEIKGLDLDDGLRDLDAIKDVIAQQQPPPLTLAGLEAILDRPEFLPPGCGATRTGTGDSKWTQPCLDLELRIACVPHYYEDNSDSCERWVPERPLFPIPMGHQWGAGSGLCGREDVAIASSIPG